MHGTVVNQRICGKLSASKRRVNPPASPELAMAGFAIWKGRWRAPVGRSAEKGSRAELISFHNYALLGQ